MSHFSLRCLCHYISWFIAKKVDYKFFWHSETYSILTIIDIFQTNGIVLGKSLFLVMLNIILCTTLLPNLIILICNITVNKHVVFQGEWNTVWILIRRLHYRKSADLDLQCYQKKINLGSAGQWLS